MQYPVCKSQAEAWKSPLSLMVQEALATEMHPFHFKAAISKILRTSGLMTSFITLPFTAESAQGKKLIAVLEQIKKDCPQSEVVKTFWWKFWDPERDVLEAAFMEGAIGQEPIMFGAHAA